MPKGQGSLRVCKHQTRGLSQRLTLHCRERRRSGSRVPGSYASCPHLADHHGPQGREQNQRREIQQIGGPAVSGVVLYIDVHPVLAKKLDHLRVVRVGNGMEARCIVLVLTVYLASDNGDLAYIATIDILQEL